MSVVLTINTAYQPYINLMGDTGAPAAAFTGKGYVLWGAASLAAAKQFTTASPDGGTVMQAGTRHAWISIKGGGIRLRCDGTDPTASAGLYLPAGTMIQVEGQAQFLAEARFIAATSESPEVTAVFFR